MASGRYTFRNGRLKSQSVTSEDFEVKAPHTNDGVYGAPYIKLYPPQGATQTPAYLYLGTGGSLRLSSSAPVGTSGVFANVGQQIATSA